MKQLALTIDVPLEIARPIRLPAVFLREEGTEKELQETDLDVADLLVLNELGLSQCCYLLLKVSRCSQALRSFTGSEVRDALQVQIDEVAVENRVGQIRAGVVRLPVGNGMQRIEREEAGAGVLSQPVD